MRAIGELYRLAEQQNITVDLFPMRSREALSLMNESGACFVAIDPRRLTGEVDERVKLAHELDTLGQETVCLAHELGHCMTGAFYNCYARLDCRRRQENKADKWAVVQLITAEQLDQAVADGCGTLWELAEYFGVTEAFMQKAVCWYTYGNLAAELYF